MAGNIPKKLKKRKNDKPVFKSTNNQYNLKKNKCSLKYELNGKLNVFLLLRN